MQVTVAGGARVEAGIGGLDGDAAPVRHGIAGVDAEVQQRILELRRIDQDRPQAGGGHHLDLDRGPDGAADQLRHAGDEPVHVRGLRVERLAAREGEQAVRQGGRPLRGALGGVDVAVELGQAPLRHAGLQEFEASRDAGEQVVEVVRDAARELAHRLHLLGLAQLLLGPVLVGEVAADDVEQRRVGLGHGRPHDGPILAVPGADAVDEARDRLPARQACHHRGGLAMVGRVDDIQEGARQQLGLAPAEHLGPGRVDGLQEPVEAGRADQVVGGLPQAVALARARLDLPLQRLGPGGEELLDALAVGDVLHEHVEAVDAPIRRAPRQVADLGVAGAAVAARPGQLEPDFLARQGPLDRGAARGIALRIEEVAHVPSDHLIRGAIEPVPVGGIGEAVDQVAVDEGDEDRQSVGHEAQLSLVGRRAQLGRAAGGDVVEQDRDAALLQPADPEGVHVEPALLQRRCEALEPDRRAGEGDAAIGVEPVLLVIGREVAHPPADRVPEAGLPREGGIGREEAIIDRLAARERHLDDAEAGIEGVEQGAVVLAGQAVARFDGRHAGLRAGGPRQARAQIRHLRLEGGGAAAQGGDLGRPHRGSAPRRVERIAARSRAVIERPLMLPVSHAGRERASSPNGRNGRVPGGGDCPPAAGRPRGSSVPRATATVPARRQDRAGALLF
ncbi:hypothetical protein AEGHOMDF_5025 [Methylobacterium soli]|nr:hypothetical protein AEGHOMDF_5025 [Methylobacterium soli]